MSHDLATFRHGDVSFYSAREPAWHRLGTVTREALNAKDALKAAHLDGWDIQKQPLTTVDASGKALTIPSKFATVRRNPDPDGPTSDTLGIVGEDYRVVQNEEAFEFLTGLVDDGEAKFETAGAIKGGARVFVTMRLPKKVRIAGDDMLDLYVAVATGHDGEFAFHAFPTPVRIVCQNTLSIALRGGKSSYVVRHDRGAAPKLAEARSILKVTLDGGDTVGRAAREMLSKPVSRTSWRWSSGTSCPSPRIRRGGPCFRCAPSEKTYGTLPSVPRPRRWAAEQRGERSMRCPSGRSGSSRPSLVHRAQRRRCSWGSPP
jgi:phage/plasmid-like protein (TIGR03299 family)